MPKDQTQTLAGYPLVVGRHLDDQNESRSAANRETRGPRGDIVAFEDGCPGFALVKICLVSETCHMPMTLDQIVEETREMPGEVVAELIDRILVARHGGIEPSVAESWKTETDGVQLQSSNHAMKLNRDVKVCQTVCRMTWKHW